MPCTVRMKFHIKQLTPIYDTTVLEYYTLPVTRTSNFDSKLCLKIPSFSLYCHAIDISPSDQNVGMNSEPPPHPLGPSLFLSFSPSFHHNETPSFPKSHCSQGGLPTPCRKVSHFSPTGTRVQVLYGYRIPRPQSAHHTPRLPVPPRQVPVRDTAIEAIEGVQGGSGETKTKKETFQSSSVQTQSARVAPYLYLRIPQVSG